MRRMRISDPCAAGECRRRFLYSNVSEKKRPLKTYEKVNEPINHNGIMKYENNRADDLRKKEVIDMIYGYARVSTPKQNLDRQLINIQSRYPEAVVFKDVFTGSKFYGRKELDKLLKIVKEGDTIIFDEVSRMSRNSEEGFELYKQLFDANVNLIFLKEPHINTDTYRRSMEQTMKADIRTGDKDADGLVADIMKAFQKYTMRLAEKQIQMAFQRAEDELRYLHRRTSEGVRAAQAAGKQVGLEKGRKLVTKKSIDAKKQITKYAKTFGGPLNDTETIKLVGIDKNTYYKYKRQLISEIGGQNV